MAISTLELLNTVGIVSAIILGFVVLRIVLRIAHHYPLVGVFAGLLMMAWVNENPDALGNAVSELTPDAIENFEIQVASNQPVAPIQEADITDENMVDYYMQQNVHFAHQVQNAPRMATAGLRR